jgi:hypothetical protein
VPSGRVRSTRFQDTRPAMATDNTAWSGRPAGVVEHTRHITNSPTLVIDRLPSCSTTQVAAVTGVATTGLELLPESRFATIAAEQEEHAQASKAPEAKASDGTLYDVVPANGRKATPRGQCCQIGILCACACMSVLGCACARNSISLPYAPRMDIAGRMQQSGGVDRGHHTTTRAKAGGLFTTATCQFEPGRCCERALSRRAHDACHVGCCCAVLQLDSAKRKDTSALLCHYLGSCISVAVSSSQVKSSQSKSVC